MNIIRGPDKRLLQVCADFDFAKPEFDPIYTASLMTRAMISAKGVGLAAPQVGKLVRMFVMQRNNGDFLACFNPVIDRQYGRDMGPEGCLSFPGEFPFISRARTIIARFHDQYSRERTFEFRDLEARAYQHELEHLNGRTIREIATSTGVALGKKAQAKR